MSDLQQQKHMFLIFCLILAVFTQTPGFPTFQQFKEKYGLIFPAQEESLRQSIYQKNIQKLIANPCATCGVTKYFASTQNELDSLHGLLLPAQVEQIIEKQRHNQQNHQNQDHKALFLSSTNQTEEKGLPQRLDWREKGAVTSVKAQGGCGTCWSFTTAALCESSLILQGRGYNTKVYQTDLSQQFLLKCTAGSSCNGGYLQNSIDKALQKGLPYQTEFPYQPNSAYYSGVCNSNDLVKVSNKIRRSYYNQGDRDIINWLQTGPVAIAVSADNWQWYSGGTFECSRNAKINHAALLVGYDKERWIIKNSWGKDFGEKGYIYVSRNPQKNCRIGVALHMLYSKALTFSILIAFLLFVLM